MATELRCDEQFGQEGPSYDLFYLLTQRHPLSVALAEQELVGVYPYVQVYNSLMSLVLARIVTIKSIELEPQIELTKIGKELVDLV
jgi:hypothetical protein